MMFGCLKYFEYRISLFTFSSKSFDLMDDFKRIFAATLFLMTSCSPTDLYIIHLYKQYAYLHLTLANDPSPRVFDILYFPILFVLIYSNIYKFFYFINFLYFLYTLFYLLLK